MPRLRFSNRMTVFAALAAAAVGWVGDAFGQAPQPAPQPPAYGQPAPYFPPPPATTQERQEPSQFPTYKPWALTGGLLYGLRAKSPATHSLGLEATYVSYPGDTHFGVGALGQLEWMNLTHPRVTLGPQLNYLFAGLEVGWSYETANKGYSALHGLHLAPFLSFAFGSIALRAVIPLKNTDGDRETRPLELDSPSP